MRIPLFFHYVRYERHLKKKKKKAKPYQCFPALLFVLENIVIFIRNIHSI